MSHILLQIAHNNDPAAFRLFFEQYHSKLLRIAHTFVSSQQIAEDIVSDVMVKLIKNRKKTFTRENFMGYLYQCIKNQSFDHLRKKKRQPLVDINYNDADYFIVENSNPSDQLIHKEFEELIADFIEGMPPKRKLVFKLVKDDGLSYKEVASLLEISDRTVEVHLRIAVKHLRVIVDEYLERTNDNPSERLRMVKSMALLIASLLPMDQPQLLENFTSNC